MIISSARWPQRCQIIHSPNFGNGIEVTGIENSTRPKQNPSPAGTHGQEEKEANRKIQNDSHVKSRAEGFN